MSDSNIRTLVAIMSDNGYMQKGSGSNFLELSTGKAKMFMCWGEVYDFVRRNFM